jgi:hypothetical protein
MGLAIAVIAMPNVNTAPIPLDGTAWLVLAALAWAALSAMWLLLLTRQNGRLLLRIEQLERANAGQTASASATASTTAGPLQVGAAVPPLRLNDARGRPFDLRNLRGTPVLFLFLDAACSHCRPLLAQLRDAQLADTNAALVVISENASLRHELPAEVTVLVDAGWTTREVFGVRGTPAAVSVDADGLLSQPPVHGTSAVRAALDQVLEVISKMVKRESPDDEVTAAWT